MKIAVPILAALLGLCACGSEPGREAPTSPSVRLAAVPGGPAAGYFEIDVTGDPGALVSVTSPQAGRIEMHETMAHGTMSRMRPLDRIPVRNGDRLVFAPGGRHLMIYDLVPAVHAGSAMTLVLHFERGPPVTLQATARDAGGP